MVVTLILLLVSGLVLIAVGVTVKAWLVWPGVAALVALGILALWWPQRNARCERRRQAYLARLRERRDDPIAIELAAHWHGGGKRPSDEQVKAILASATARDPPRAAVVCLGKIDAPEVGEIFFEPEIITPTRYIGRRLIFIPIAGALIFLWVLHRIGVLPFRFPQLSSFGYLLWMGAAVGGAWVWRSAVRPTYIRMAPGIIQILQYRYRRAKPLIRSYPMDGETLAILRGKATGKKGPNLALTLLRADQKDTVDLSRMRKREEVAERMWQALLSTAPTPPLSDEELVG